MKIEVVIDNRIKGKDTLARWIREAVERNIFSTAVEVDRIEVHLTPDAQCRIYLWPVSRDISSHPASARKVGNQGAELRDARSATYDGISFFDAFEGAARELAATVAPTPAAKKAGKVLRRQARGPSSARS